MTDPTLENLLERMKNRHKDLQAMAFVIGNHVHCQLSMRIGEGVEWSVLGTLIVPLADYPVLVALLGIGSSMLRLNYKYQLIDGHDTWEQEYVTPPTVR